MSVKFLHAGSDLFHLAFGSFKEKTMNYESPFSSTLARHAAACEICKADGMQFFCFDDQNNQSFRPSSFWLMSCDLHDHLLHLWLFSSPSQNYSCSLNQRTYAKL